MRYSIPLSLWKWNLRSQPKDEAIENIFDIKGENSFLRKVLLLMALVAVGETGMIFIQNRRLLPVYAQETNGDVIYAQEVQLSSRTLAGMDTAPMATESCNSTQRIAQVQPSVPDSSPQPAFVPSAKREKSFIAQVPQKEAAVGPSAAPVAPQPETAKPEASFWDLLRQVQTDPEREIIDKSYAANGLSVTIQEVSRSGLVHFELQNDSSRIVYLPKISVPGAKVRVYLERQVLEPGTSEQAVLVFDDPKLVGGSVEAIVSAANVKPFKLRFELPHWR